MTMHTPTHARPHLTVEEITAAAAALIAEARTAGLLPPFGVTCHDYGPPEAALHLGEHDSPDIWAALDQWADRYGTVVTTRPGHGPGTIYARAIYARAGFTRDGITYEVSSVITTAADKSQPVPQEPAA